MKRRLNSDKLKEWIDHYGSIPAENRIREVTGYSLSTLQKMKDGSYNHCPGFAERRALVDITGMSEDVLFPVCSEGDAAS